MADLQGVPWPPEPMATDRLVVRAPRPDDRPVLLAGHLGFVEAERFVEFGAEQWFGVRRPEGRP